MKIVPKLTLALVAGMCLVLAINGYLRVRRETAAFEAERTRRHSIVGRAIGAAVKASWKTDGETAALTMLSSSIDRYDGMQARWLPAGGPHGAQSSPASSTTTKIDRTRTPAVWLTYVPVEVAGQERGVIELIERGGADEELRRGVITETLETAAALAALSALIAFFLGEWLVGKPMRALIDGSRRIGRGDFDHVIALRSRDELAELGDEMDAMRARLTSTVAQLRHTDRLATLGELAAGVAHELGTPLNVVSARAEMILGGHVGGELVVDYTTAIASAADRMAAILQKFMRFARRSDLQRTPVSPGSMVREAAELLRPLATKHGVDLVVEPDDAAPISIDGSQLQQVVTNLVMNAVHASPAGAVVVVRLEESTVAPPSDIGGAARECIRIHVTDAGDGIAPDHLPHIFEPFFTTKEVGNGTGLGLAVSYGIVRDHGGWISVDSTVGVGTTFAVHIPRRASP